MSNKLPSSISAMDPCARELKASDLMLTTILGVDRNLSVGDGGVSIQSNTHTIEIYGTVGQGRRPDVVDQLALCLNLASGVREGEIIRKDALQKGNAAFVNNGNVMRLQVLNCRTVRFAVEVAQPHGRAATMLARQAASAQKRESRHREFITISRIATSSGFHRDSCRSILPMGYFPTLEGDHHFSR
jgi:hypothetical protein